MSGLNINNKSIVIGKEIGAFNTKKDAMASASINQGSEVIFKKDDKWHVEEVKDKGLIYNTNLSRNAESKLEIANKSSKNPNDLTISFVEDDVKPENKTKLAKTTSSQYVLDKLADEKPLSTTLQSLGLMGNDLLRVKTQVAANPNTSSETLEKLAKEERIVVKTEIAKNPNTSAKTLSELAKSESSVAQFVAANNNTPIKTLEELYTRKNFSINKSLATNPNTPINILKELSKDSSGENQLKNKVAANPNTPTAILDSLAKSSGNDSNIKESLINNPHTSKSTKHNLTH